MYSSKIGTSNKAKHEGLPRKTGQFVHYAPFVKIQSPYSVSLQNFSLPWSKNIKWKIPEMKNL
jgi:hypothetical protein